MKSKNKSVKFSMVEGIFKLKPSVRLRLIVSGVAFYAKVADVCLGFSSQMNAVEKAENELARLMGLGEPCNGLCATFDGVSVQIDVIA